MQTTLNVDYLSADSALVDMFPLILFFPPTWPETLKKQADIYPLLIKSINPDNGAIVKEDLLRQMIKSELFKVLFPKDIQPEGKEWNNLAEHIRQDDSSGSHNILEYFFQQIDKLFLEAFNTSVCKEIKLKEPAATNSFYDELFRSGSRYVESFKEPKNLIGCEHSPHSIYGTFKYYAHKQYTLIRLGREFSIADIHERWKTDLEEKLSDSNKDNNYFWLKEYYRNEHQNDFIDAYEKAFKEIKKEIGETEKEISYAWKILNRLFLDSLEKKVIFTKEKDASAKELERNEIFALYTDEITKKIKYLLEGRPEIYKATPYIPQDFFLLAGQISGQMGQIYKKIKSISKSEQYKKNNGKFEIPASDLQNIQNYCNKLEKHLTDKNNHDLTKPDIEQAQIIIKSGDNYAKIKLLFKLIQNPYFNKILPGQPIKTIKKLQSKISEETLPDQKQNNDDDENKDYYDPVKISYPGIYEESETADSRKALAKQVQKELVKQVKEEFNAEDEKDFVDFFSKKRNLLLITPELEMYRKNGTHISEGLLFTEYRKKQKNISHELFAIKIRKIIKTTEHKYEKSMNHTAGESYGY